MEGFSKLEEILERDGRLAYTCKGFSMLPLLREDRDVVLIRKKGASRCRKLDAVLFKRPGVEGRGSFVLHRVLKVMPDGAYWIVGDHCTEGETVREENVLGVMTAVVRDGRTVPVTAFRYRLYLNTWCRFYHLRFFLLRIGGFFGRFF
ncbi:MAG: S24/S26 family peptidase [Clostridia bacterium]|nr:S24/S26 family peptidase [Clostridia bacterium]